MNDPQIDSLIFPFASGAAPLPAAGARLIGFGIQDFSSRFARLDASITFIQPWRPAFRALSDAGCRVVAEPEGEGYDGALVRLGRHRGQNDHWLAESVRRLKEGAWIAAAGARTDGAASARRRAAALAPGTRHAAMNHGEVFWFAVPADASHLASRLEPEAPALVEGRFRSAPGMFSHRHSDPGSRLLAESIPAGLSGRVADFGAGWGFLSAMLLDRCPHLSGIDLYEADFDALGAARLNVVPRPGVELAFLWRDLLQESAERRYDAVVMNPPFHAGRRADPELGRAMIAAATRALKPGGRLFMVANLRLPYEAALRAGFRHVRELGVGSGFKVIEAVR